jgi:hypothetical protein
MQTFAVEFHLSYKGKSLESIVTVPFDVETFADLLMQIQQGESDLTIRQRLLDAIAFEEEDVQFDEFGFGNIYNQLGELEFDIDNPNELQLTSLSPEGDVIADEEEDEEDYSDDEEETKTLH